MSEPGACERVEGWLVDQLPSSDPAPRWLGEHAAGCSACASLIAAESRLRVCVAGLSAPRDAVWERIRARTASGALEPAGHAGWLGRWLRWPALALAAVLLVTSFSRRTPDVTSRIAACAGDVSVVAGGKQTPAAVGRVLAPGAWVLANAGGSCALELPGARVEAGPLTQLVLEQGRQVRMLSGSAHFRVQPVREAAGGVSFRVHLPGGDLEVRGTSFRVQVEPAQSQVWLEEGHLRVRASSGTVRDLEPGENVGLPAGQLAPHASVGPGAAASASPTGRAPADEQVSERAVIEPRASASASASATGRPPLVGRTSTGGF